MKTVPAGNINTDYWVEKQASSGITQNFWTPIKGGYDIGEVVRHQLLIII